MCKRTTKIKIKNLKKEFNADVFLCAYITDGVYLEGDETPDYAVIVDQDGNCYLENSCKSVLLDVDRTNARMKELGLNPFSEWSFEFTAAVYFDGNNWKIDLFDEYLPNLCTN